MKSGPGEIRDILRKTGWDDRVGLGRRREENIKERNSTLKDRAVTVDGLSAANAEVRRGRAVEIDQRGF